MIPVLFEKDEINFLNNGLGSLPNVVESYAKQTANSEYELFLVYPTLDEVEGISNKIWEELKIPERQILYKPSHGSEPHAFRIYDYEINTEDETISVYARSRAYDLAGNPIKDVVIQSKTPQAAMNAMKAALMEPTDFEFYSDITTPSSTTWTKRSGLSTIMGQSGSLIQIWGGEVFRENRKISLLRRAGKDNVTSLRLGKNINQLEYDFSADGMVTAIIPYCTFTTDGEDAKEITLVGDTVKSPKFYNYRLPYYEFIEFTEEDGVVDLLTLNNAASNWFNDKRGIDEPNVSISVDMMDIAESTEYGDILKKLETVNVFDTLSVYIEKYNIDLLIKVNTLKYDGIGERNLEVELGNVTKSLFESFVSPDFKTIEEQINEAKKIGLTAQGSANGKNTNYHGHDDPNQLEVVGQNGDIYFREIFNERQMWEFYNGQWNLIIDTSENTSIKNSVDEAQVKAEEAKQEAENAYNDAVAEADRLVTAQTEAFDAEMTLRKGEITAIQNNINAELSRVDQAISDNFTSLSDTLDDVDAISKQAKLDAQTAASNAQAALSNAKTAISTATSANNKAIKSSVIEWVLSASGTTPPTTGWSTTVPTPSATQYTWGRTTITLNDGTTIPSYNVSKMGVKGDPGAPGAGGAKGDKGDAGVNAPKITAVKQYFYLSSSNTSQTGGSWTETIPVWSSGKYYWTRVVTSYDNATTTESVPVLDNSLNQSLVTSLEAKSATQTLSTTVSQHATQIALKASQTSVDSLTGRVGASETNISANATAINLRATKASVDTLTGRVSAAEASISVQAGKIDLAATKTELTTAINGIEVGGRNLVLNTGGKLYRTFGAMATLSKVDGATRLDWVGVGQTSMGEKLSVPLIVGESYTLTFEARGTISPGIEIYILASSGGNLSISHTLSDGVVTGEFKKYTATFKYNGNPSYSLYIGGTGPAGAWLEVKDGTVKLEKGNKATDWTPAPEDIEASIATLSSELTVEAGKIALAATKTELTTAIDGIQVGGRNLLKNSANIVVGGLSFAAGSNKEYHTVPIGQTLMDLDEGTEITISFDIQMAKGNYLMIYNSNTLGVKYFDARSLSNIGTKKQRVSVTTFVRNRSNPRVNYNSIEFYSTYGTSDWYRISNIKIEKGNKATDWTPAPEDVDASISTVQSNLTVEAGKITAVTARVSGTESSIASVKQTADGNKATVANHAGQISTINQTVSGLQSTVASKADKSQITQLSNSISSVVTNLNNLEVGGRNLYRDSGRQVTSNQYNITEYQFASKPIAGEKYTISIKGKINPAHHTGFYTNIYNGTAHPQIAIVGPEDLGSDGVYRKTFTMPNLANYISTILYSYPLGTYVEASVEWIKLEKGNKATDWTPAPEDMATESRVTQLANNINLRIVEKGNVVAQLNIDNGTTLISNKKLVLDANTYIMGTTFANDIKAKSIEAVNANITSIRTSILAADVITSGMVATSTALITKIFATDATVTTLTGKTAFINSVKAVTIAADKITSGTLNAANVNIINLNVSKLVGNISNFVQSAWNAINSTVSITGDGIVSSNSAGRFVHYSNGGVVFGGGGERTVLRNNTGATTNRSGISLEPVGSNMNSVDFDIYTRGTSAFHMGTSDYDLGYRLRLANSDTNTNNYYISLKTGSQFDFELGKSTAANTSKNTLEIQRYDANGNIRIGKNASFGASMFISGNDIIFAKGGTTSRVNVYANRFIGTGFTYLEGSNVYSIEKTISHIIQQLQWYTSYFSATKWQNA